MLKKLSILYSISVLIAISVIVVFAQDNSTATPLNQEDTLALLTQTGLNILPIEAITAEPLVVSKLTATSATISFVTSRATNCIIVYGETTDFGQVTQDSDMGNGFTHTHHHPIMGNLKPDTQYYYRFQGSDENGNIFVSDILTLHTPAESNSISDNLLSPDNGAKVLEVSSNYANQPNDGTWGINNAFDDDPNTAWATNGDGNNAYVTVQLGQESHINRISFWTRTMSNNTSQIYSFTVTTDTGDVYGPFKLADPEQAYEFNVDFDAKTLRFDVADSNGGNTGAVEIGAYGNAVSN